MVIGYKDIFKMAGILVVSFCAVFVCALFLNYYLDLTSVEDMVAAGPSRIFYEAQCDTSKVVSIVSGGCLLLTTVVLICFYIGHYIDTHQKQLGILKALGYSRNAIAREFGAFGLPVCLGTAVGYAGAHCLMPLLYEVQNKEGYLPDVEVAFHPLLCAALVGLPTVFFVLLAVCYSYYKLKIPALALMRGIMTSRVVRAKKETEQSFLRELRKSNVRQRRSLIFFIAFAVFCFAAMTQMSYSMNELASPMMSVMMMAIGIVLACVTLFIATTSVIKANGKTVIMMKVFGYPARDCARAVLGGYRPYAYLGFLAGTIYQYALLKIMVNIVFLNVEGIPDYEFNWPVMAVSLASFLVLYETIMFFYTRKMEKLPLKEIMLE